ncbi:hypothetical protein B0H14DRAFT_2433405 [Mycena olivaceomarginata]|nr:hypothetical protein B0H14DRAFT_2433405 [Mycena olivaceomarginata]
MTRMKTPPPPDPFKAHLLAVLNLHDAATPVPRYSGPRDSQTDAILRKVEALMRKTGGTPDSEGPHDTTVEEHAPTGHGSESRGPADDPESVVITRGVPCPVCGHRLLQPVDYAAERPVTASEAATTDVQEDIDTREELRLLKEQIHDISRVCSAIAVGDLTQRVTVPVQDGMVKLKEVINTMADTFGCFSTEVTRVLVDLCMGRLGSCALVDGAQGTWYELTQNVNAMSSNLTAQVRAVARATTAIANGDLSVRVDVHAGGEMLDLKETVNEMAMRLGYFASEVGRIAVEVGTEGRMGGQAEMHGAQGTWADLVEKINRMDVNLTGQIRSIGIVIREVALGNFGWMMSGEMRDLKDTVNVMVEQFRYFSSEVTPLALKVGTYGMLGGHAEIAGAQGARKDLTDTLNSMTVNLKNQVRSTSYVAMVAAREALTKTINFDVRG